MQITKRTKIIWGILLLVLLASIGLLWTQQTPSPSMPPELRDVTSPRLADGRGLQQLPPRHPRAIAPAASALLSSETRAIAARSFLPP